MIPFTGFSQLEKPRINRERAFTRQPPPPVPDPRLQASYNWWKYINPTNVNNLSVFTNVNPINYDTGLLAYSRRTAINLTGWLNKNIDLVNATGADSLVHLSVLTQLEAVQLSAFATDASLAQLRSLTRLRELLLAISGSPAPGITDKGMSFLASLPSIEKLGLFYCTNITDVGLQWIGRLPNLKELYLTFSAITDEGLNGLKPLQKLEVLNIAKSANITDKGAEVLINLIKQWPSFRKLLIPGTAITEKGRKRLSDAGISFVY